MASTLTIASTIIKVAVDLEIDQAELALGALVKVGQIGSTGGNPVYVYLSENANAT